MAEHSKDGRAKTWESPWLLRPLSFSSKSGSSLVIGPLISAIFSWSYCFLQLKAFDENKQA